MNLFQIESESYKNLNIGDIIEINGKDLSGHGRKIYNIYNEKPNSYNDVLESIMSNNPILDDRILEIYDNLKNENRDFQLGCKEIILENVRMRLDINLLSRLRSIFLSTKKDIHKWVYKLKSSDKPIYEFKILEETNRYEGDEEFWNSDDYWDIKAKNYWSKSSTKGVNHLYEVVFQGKIQVVNIYNNYIDFKEHVYPL